MGITYRRVFGAFFRTATSLGAGVVGLYCSPAVAQVQDILVTARKEEETLHDVPISVAAYDEELIQRYDISDLSDVAARTPNFTFSNNLGLSQGVPVIRGVGTPRIGGSSSVGVFIDGIDTGNSTGLNLQSFDIERVEVVRGPQSTQFGRGVMAGAINYVTKRPNLDKFEASFASEVGEHELVRIDGRMSVPVTDSVAVSLAGQRRSFEGFYRNSVSGRPVGESDSVAVVGGLRARFGSNDQGEAYLRLAYSRENLGQPAWHQVATNTQTGAAASQRWFIGRLTGDPAKIAHNGDKYAQMDLDFYRAALHLDYDFDSVAIASVTSYNRSSQLQDTDGDYTASPDLILGPTMAGNLRAYTDVDIEDFSQELRLRSNGDGPLQWMVGGYFRKEDYRNFDYSPTGAQGSSNVLAPTPNRLNRKVETYGAFGSLSYQISPALSVSQELRYAEDRVRETSQPRAALVAGAFERKFTNVLPRTILEYKVDADRAGRHLALHEARVEHHHQRRHIMRTETVVGRQVISQPNGLFLQSMVGEELRKGNVLGGVFRRAPLGPVGDRHVLAKQHPAQFIRHHGLERAGEWIVRAGGPLFARQAAAAHEQARRAIHGIAPTDLPKLNPGAAGGIQPAAIARPHRIEAHFRRTGQV